MQQYLDIKSQHSDKLLLFRVGDFYEFFFDDAIEVSKLLLLVLTSKGKCNDVQIPMAGFPVRSANSYIIKLMRLNKKIAICEQVNNIKKNGLIERKVVKILTPGTFFNDDYFLDDRNNYIVCITFLNGIYGIASLDVSTGYFFITRVDNKIDLYNELDKLNPLEVVVSEKSVFIKNFHKKFFISKISDIKFDYYFAYNILLKFFKHKGIDHIDQSFFNQSIISAGVLLDFIESNQRNKLENVIYLEVNFVDNFLYLDHNSRKNLELFKSFSGNDKDSLFNIIDKTVTPIGKRLLHRWLTYPVLSRSVLNDRFSSVSILKTNQRYLNIKQLLLEIFDLERILGKLVFSSIKPIDLKRLQSSLKILPAIKLELENFELDGVLEAIFHNMSTFDNLVNLIDSAVNDNPASSILDGDVIKKGFDKKLDEYRMLAKDFKDCVVKYQDNERKRLNIPGLYINFLTRSGYVIEIPSSETFKVSNDYRKVSSTAKVFRYVCDDLVNIERKISDAKINLIERERKIYKIILYKIKKSIVKLQVTAKYIAILDVINSFAIQSSFYNWCEPVLVDECILDIRSGRHPVIEYKKDNIFIPNDLFLDSNSKGLIITGANMGGKSTYMRQAAIIILLAHIGSHVPASFAKIGKIDKIFTRIGACDDLANSYSTFMLEMSEISDILLKSTSNSFILVDEIGRGTGYIDGKALAVSIIKELVEVNKSFFLFSTHFHDLHLLCELFNVLGKICFTAVINNEDIVFFYKIEKGFSDQSFGIEVARTAGVAKSVIDYAILKRNDFKSNFLLNSYCLDCFRKDKVFNFIKNIDPDLLSPKEALDYIYRLKDLFHKN